MLATRVMRISPAQAARRHRFRKRPQNPRVGLICVQYYLLPQSIVYLTSQSRHEKAETECHESGVETHEFVVRDS